MLGKRRRKTSDLNATSSIEKCPECGEWPRGELRGKFTEEEEELPLITSKFAISTNKLLSSQLKTYRDTIARLQAKVQEAEKRTEKAVGLADGTVSMWAELVTCLSLILLTAPSTCEKRVIWEDEIASGDTSDGFIPFKDVAEENEISVDTELIPVDIKNDDNTVKYGTTIDWDARACDIFSEENCLLMFDFPCPPAIEFPVSSTDDNDPYIIGGMLESEDDAKMHLKVMESYGVCGKQHSDINYRKSAKLTTKPNRMVNSETDNSSDKPALITDQLDANGLGHKSRKSWVKLRPPDTSDDTKSDERMTELLFIEAVSSAKKCFMPMGDNDMHLGSNEFETSDTEMGGSCEEIINKRSFLKEKMSRLLRSIVAAIEANRARLRSYLQIEKSKTQQINDCTASIPIPQTIHLRDEMSRLTSENAQLRSAANTLAYRLSSIASVARRYRDSLSRHIVKSQRKDNDIAELTFDLDCLRKKVALKNSQGAVNQDVSIEQSDLTGPMQATSSPTENTTGASTLDINANVNASSKTLKLDTSVLVNSVKTENEFGNEEKITEILDPEFSNYCVVLQKKLDYREEEMTKLQKVKAALISEVQRLNLELCSGAAEYPIMNSKSYCDLKCQSNALSEELESVKVERDKLLLQMQKSQSLVDLNFENALSQSAEHFKELTELLKRSSEEADAAIREKDICKPITEGLLKKLDACKQRIGQSEANYNGTRLALTRQKLISHQLRQAASSLTEKQKKMKNSRNEVYSLAASMRTEIANKADRIEKLEAAMGKGIFTDEGKTPFSNQNATDNSGHSDILKPSDDTNNKGEDVSGFGGIADGAGSREACREEGCDDDVANDKSNLLNRIKVLERENLELLLDVQHKERQVNDFETLELEFENVKSNYELVSAEVEEVSIAFEDQLAECERLSQLLKEKEDAALEKFTNETKSKEVTFLLQCANTHSQEQLKALKEQLRSVSQSQVEYSTVAFHSSMRASIAEEEAAAAVEAFLQMRENHEALQQYTEQCQNRVKKAKKIAASYERRAIEAERLASEEVEIMRSQHDKIVLMEGRKLDAINKVGLQETPVVNLADNVLLEDVESIKLENKAFRKRMLCSLCSEHMKDVFIKKCGHIFCRSCLQSSFHSRNRKCPQCNLIYQQTDIRRLFLE